MEPQLTPPTELFFHHDYTELWRDINRHTTDDSFNAKYLEISQLMGKYATLNNQFISIFNTQTQRVLYMSQNYLDVMGYKCTEEEYKRWSTFYWMRDLPMPQSWFFMQMTLFFKKTVQPLLRQADSNKALHWYMHNFILHPPKTYLRHINLTGLALEITPDGSMPVMMLIIKDVSSLIKEDSPWWAEFCINETHKYCFHQNEKKFQKGSILSDREREVLLLIKAGNETKAIADMLFISPHTVDKHRKNMLERTGAKDISTLIHLCEAGKVL